VLKNEYLSEASKRGFNLRGLNFDGIYQFMKEFKLDFHKNNKRKELPSSKCYLINGTRSKIHWDFLLRNNFLTYRVW